MAKFVGFSCLWESDWIMYLWYRVVWLSSLVFSNSTRTIWGQWGVWVARFVVICFFSCFFRKIGVSLRTLMCLLCLSEGIRARWMWLKRSSSSGCLLGDFTLRVYSESLARKVVIDGCGCWWMVMVMGFDCCDHLGCFRWGWLRGGYCNYATIVQSSLKDFVFF